MRKISKARDLLLEAVEASKVVVLDATNVKVKRVNPLPRDPVEALRRYAPFALTPLFEQWGKNRLCA